MALEQFTLDGQDAIVTGAGFGIRALTAYCRSPIAGQERV